MVFKSSKLRSECVSHEHCISLTLDRGTYGQTAWLDPGMLWEQFIEQNFDYYDGSQGYIKMWKSGAAHPTTFEFVRIREYPESLFFSASFVECWVHGDCAGADGGVVLESNNPDCYHQGGRAHCPPGNPKDCYIKPDDRHTKVCYANTDLTFTLCSG